MAAEVGAKAPGFTLAANGLENTIPPEYRSEKWPVALFSYPGARSGVYTDQMVELRAEIGRFHEGGASVLAVGAGSAWPHRAFAADRGIGFPLLADSKEEVIGGHCVGREAGLIERACSNADRDGGVWARKVGSSPEDGPEVEAVLRDPDGVI